MKTRTTTTTALFVFLLNQSCGLSYGQEQPVRVGGKFGEARIESDYTFIMPPELPKEEVWKYLNLRYAIGTDKYILANQPDIATRFSDENFEDTYFDNSKWQILESDSGVRYRRRSNTTDPEDRKSGRELVQVKLKPFGAGGLFRNELKFPVDHYSRAKDPWDSHPLYGLVRRDMREGLRDEIVNQAHFEDDGWRSIVNLSQRRRRVYIDKDGKSYMTITMDEVSSTKYWKTVKYNSMEFELGEIAYTSSDPTQRAAMEEMRKILIDDILKRFPSLKLDTTPKYKQVVLMFEKQIPFFRYLVRNF